MKKILLLLLTASLLISNIVFMTSCDVEAEGGDESPSETEAPAESEPEEGRFYGEYQIITVTDEATIELVENMWCDDSWMNVGFASSFETQRLFFDLCTFPENIYLQEILKREDGVDLLLWRFEKFINKYEETGKYTDTGWGYRYIAACMLSESVSPLVTEEQRAAYELMGKRLWELQYGVQTPAESEPEEG